MIKYPWNGRILRKYFVSFPLSRKRNDDMTYILSDVHGEYELFLRLMEKVKFSCGDTLISCGDMIEKGKHSVRLLKLLFSMQSAVLLAGNHEYDFLKYYWSLMRDAREFSLVLEKLQRYFPDDGDLLDWDTVDRLESLPYFHETDDFLCVHAGVPLTKDGHMLPLDLATCEQLVYDRTFKDPWVLPKAGKCVFFGHTPTINLGLAPKIVCYPREGAKGNKVADFYKVHLDTGTWLSGILGCFCVETCVTFYVSRER